jgi:hypothetical protein
LDIGGKHPQSNRTADTKNNSVTEYSIDSISIDSIDDRGDSIGSGEGPTTNPPPQPIAP